MDDLLEGLNRAQREAVTSEASVLQVLAPPGSGKTKTLTARVGWLIKQGLEPSNIVVCTFTVKAANEMQERIGTLVGEQKRKRLKIGTFHSIALLFLRSHRRETGLRENFGVADSNDSLNIVKDICKRLDASIDAKQARNRISTIKSKGMDCDTYAAQGKNKSGQQEFLGVFQEYEAQLSLQNLLDFDDILLTCVALLRKHPHCVSHIHAVLVDEFQDTNGVQYELMSLFAQRRQFITIVGDPDQSIYGWRSAEIKNLSRMKERWLDTLTINLEENYRSAGGILHASQVIIEQDEKRPPKKLQATHSFGHKPVLRKLPSSRDEAKWIVAEIQRVRALTGNLFQYDDIAILLRSASLSRLIEHALTHEKIPYRMVGGVRFYDRKEIQVVLDYLRVMNCTEHGEALRRVLNIPPRGIGDGSVLKLQDEALSRKTSLWQVITDITHGTSRLRLGTQIERGLSQFENVIINGQKKLAEAPNSLVELIEWLNGKVGLEAWLKTKYAEDHESRWANVQELVAQAGDANLAEQALIAAREGVEIVGASGESNAAELISDETPLNRFLSNAALAAKSDANSDAETKNHVVTISTVHAAKGLEWPLVFIPACFNGSIPHSRAEDQDEERRLLYVGMTRAQAMLYLSCPTKDSQRQETTLSTFLAQSGVSSYFEECGPTIRNADAVGLARVLHREPPTSMEIAQSAALLEQEQDDYWPVNGEAPYGYIEERDRPAELPVFGTTRTATSLTSNGSSIIGFQSVKERFADLNEKQERLAQERIRKRVEAASRAIALPKSRRKHIAGQGALNFGSIDKPTLKRSSTAGDTPALVDITNTTTSEHETTMEACKERRLVSSAPLFKRAKTSTSASEDNTYHFMSSSPTKSDDGQQENTIDESSISKPLFKAASTLHTMSIGGVGKDRKRYGLGGGFKPWGAGRKT